MSDLMTYDEIATPEALDTLATDSASTDAVPPLSTDYEYSCETCGRELFYGGRGRKPKLCKKGEGCRSGEAPATRRANVNSSGRWQQPLANALTQNFVGIGLVAYTFDQFDGQTIINGSPRLAESLVHVAETNESVKKALQTFVNGGAWAQVAIAAATIALPIMQHHNIGPRIPMPSVLVTPTQETHA